MLGATQPASSLPRCRSGFSSLYSRQTFGFALQGSSLSREPVGLCPASSSLLSCNGGCSIFIQRSYAKKPKKRPPSKTFAVFDSSTAKKIIDEKKRAEEREEEKKEEKKREERFKKKKKSILHTKAKKLAGDKTSKKKVLEAEIVAGTPTAPQQQAEASQALSNNDEDKVATQSKKQDEEETEGEEEVASDTDNRIRERGLVPVTNSLGKVEKPKKKKKKLKKEEAKASAYQRSSIDRPSPPKYDWPTTLYADTSLAILDIPTLRFSGMDVLGEYHILQEDEWIPIPSGGHVWAMENRISVGHLLKNQNFFNVQEDPRLTGKEAKRSGLPWAVAATLPSPYVTLRLPAHETMTHATVLPLMSQTAVGWYKGDYVVSAMRVDDHPRHDYEQFDGELIESKIELKLKEMPNNRLVEWVANCAREFDCPTANNYFMGRWEAPIPVATECNSKCIGCPNKQDNLAPVTTFVERIAFTPTVEEIAEMAIGHLRTAPEAIVSFGQTCDGEPLMNTEIIAGAIRTIRKATKRGTIHMNTNGTLPNCVAILRKAGLDSMAVSLNTVRLKFYAAYNRPEELPEVFERIKKSIKIMKDDGGFVSLNYMMVPGFTDQVEEFEKLCEFLKETNVDMVQWRNLNIDPEWYIKTIDFINKGPNNPRLRERMGIKVFMEKVKEAFPTMRFGHFNPCLDPGASKYNFEA